MRACECRLKIRLNCVHQPPVLSQGGSGNVATLLAPKLWVSRHYSVRTIGTHEQNENLNGVQYHSKSDIFFLWHWA